MAWKYLRTNDCTWRPQNVLCVDTETVRIPTIQSPGKAVERFRLGVAKSFCLRRGRYSNPRSLRFTDPGDFWGLVETLARSRGCLWIFAHNVGFDSCVLGFWRLLDCGRFVRVKKRDRRHGSKTGVRQSEYATGLLITTDPPTVVEAWTKAGGKIRMVDTLNYWPVSLAEIGTWIGLDKLPMPDPWESDTAWFDYCERDTDILVRSIQRYIEWVSEHKLGQFAVTLPSQAMHGYRHTMAAKSIVLHDEKEVQKLESEGYLGGEIWCGKIGHCGRGDYGAQRLLGNVSRRDTKDDSYQVHQLDCNSLFPAVMAGNLYPRRLVEWHLPTVARRSAVERIDGSCIAECLLDSHMAGIYTRRKGRSGRFTGLFVAVLCGPEILAAKECNAIVAVRRYARYEMGDLFTVWVNTWWQKRYMAKLAGNIFEDQLCKRLSNSLYGKWAQKRYEWEDLPGQTWPDRWACWTDLDLSTNAIQHYRSIAGTVQRANQKGYHSNAFVAISAFVTAYARVRMQRLREIAGQREVYYQGVDSLFVSDTGMERLRGAGEIDGGRLGLLRHETSAETAYFAGWGLYRFGNRWVRTAIGRGAVECSPGEFEQCNFERLGQALSHEPIDGVTTQRLHKKLMASNPVGIIGQDGWVQPLPAIWGDNKAESTDPRGFYYDDLRNK